MGERFSRYLQAVRHEPLALAVSSIACFACGEPAAAFHAVEHPARRDRPQLVISKSARGAAPDPSDRCACACDGACASPKTLEHAGDIGPVEAIVAVAAASLRLDQAAGFELRRCELAVWRRAPAWCASSLASACAAGHQRRQHVGARGIAASAATMAISGPAFIVR